jgi:hypothetical protein
MYPQVIEEFKAYGRLSGDANDSGVASAMEEGFRSAGWKGALTKGIEFRQTQRKSGYSSAFEIATLYAELGDKDSRARFPRREKTPTRHPRPEASQSRVRGVLASAQSPLYRFCMSKQPLLSRSFRHRIAPS